MTFEEQLQAQVGDFMTVIIKSGGDSCKHRGILCSIRDDFIVLVYDDERIEIPINQIASVRKLAGGVSEEDYYDDRCYEDWN
ncbi:hypothetical protein [Sporohalobacter salinus]|uniref:hypothetical protein n=1 Tax=Sporohalobacter salinus TaxID=1494606 RepID=UPI00196206A1|nr:hypothetical protein [Sporohalobacter salinus]MBM7622671.1 hypothetical protein [Sporohalobacter salinus]